MEGRERTLESCSHGVRLSRGVSLVVGREISLCRVLGYEQMRGINRPSSHSLARAWTASAQSTPNREWTRRLFSPR